MKPELGKSPFTLVYKTEEKGSDVNLAVHLLHDAWLDAYDCAVLVSNDSDLAEPLRLIKSQLNRFNILIFPNEDKRRQPSRQLAEYADFIKRVRHGVLRNSQLPNEIPNTVICKPDTW